MPYPHKELSKEPLEALEMETNVGFQAERLTKDQRIAFEALHDEVITKRYGEPFDIATHIFNEF